MGFTILSADSTSRPTGVSFRRQKLGPENDLVQEFLKNFSVDTPRGCHTTIFCEPQIESGFPDLVVVSWSIATAKKWTSERAALTQNDIRLIHYLHQVGPQSMETIRPFFSKGLNASLERLEAARLLSRSKDLFKPKALASSFAVRRIIAIEAKVTDWSAGVQQAFLNTWFATDSFVLLPQARHSPKVQAAARSRGIQLCSLETNIDGGKHASAVDLPRSYASWLFNEWAWRNSSLMEGLQS